MFKKLLIIFCIILLISSIIPVNAVDIKKDEKTIINYKSKNFDEINIYNYPTMTEYIDFTDITEKGKPEIVDTPDYFSWGDYNGKNWLTPVKTQLCGDCWDFAAIGTFESIIKIRENCPELTPDLSEQYVLSCLPGAGSCHGGSSNRAFNLILDTSEKGNYCNGVILESCFYYQGSDDIPCDDKCVDWEEKLVPILEYGMWKPSRKDKGIEEIKTFIMQNGPVVAHIDATNYFKYWGSIHKDPDDYFHYTGPKLISNHVVVMIGWKDDPDVRRGGYWICKNSWGTNWGYDGFFNIEYGSLTIDKAPIVWVDYDPDSYDWDPIASAGSSFEVDVGEEITFDGSDSTDAENEIVSYLWNFDDGETSNKKIASHSYLEPGIYEVTLTVTDASCNIDTDTTYVWVEKNANPPDIPVINGQDNVKPKKEYTYTVSSSDPEDDEIFYLINTGGYEQKDWIGPFESGEEITIKKSWAYIGKHQIKVKVKDKYGLESDWEILPINKKIFLFGNILFLRDILSDMF